MRSYNLLLIVVVFLMLVSCGFLKKTVPSQIPETGGMMIVNFTEDSNLQKAGAKPKDILWKYDGKIVYSVQHLGELKNQVTTETVEVVIFREGELINLEIASGQIGVYLLPVPREHTIESDAQIIEGIGRLQWGNDMEISFFGALHMIEKYRGQNLSYDDLMVLSGYGYRTCFFDGWCPSSPDATCGYDCGDDILKKLGYKYEYLFLEGMDTADENYNMKTCSWDELREQIKSSIDNGYPLLAIDLIQVPEWGIITGYQKNGEELFCRTYFDQTEGYEIAQKRPWVIIRIYGKENVDIAPLYDQSLQLAATLYEVPSYQKYTNGINATQTWIAHLQDEDYLLALKPQEFAETAHANTWIYYALSDTRQKTAEYLVLHKADFSADPALFDRFCNIYRQEAEILQNGIKNVAAFDVIKTPQTWTQPMRSQQILTLQQYLNLEMQAQQLLNTMTKVDKLKK